MTSIASNGISVEAGAIGMCQGQGMRKEEKGTSASVLGQGAYRGHQVPLSRKPLGSQADCEGEDWGLGKETGDSRASQTESPGKTEVTQKHSIKEAAGPRRPQGCCGAGQYLPP